MPVVENAGEIGSENGKYMVEFQADARVGVGEFTLFSIVDHRLGLL